MTRGKSKGPGKKGKRRKTFPVNPDFQDRNLTSVDHMKKKGKSLKSPFSELPGSKLVSWVDTCIPNILWACILTMWA